MKVMKYKNFFDTYENYDKLEQISYSKTFHGTIELYYYLREVMVYQNFFATC